MKMLNLTDNFEEAFEKFAGEKPDATVISFVKQLNKVGKAFEDKGRKDATQNRQVPSDDVFLACGKKTFFDDPEMAASMSELMEYCYLDGYNAGKVLS